MLACRTMAVWKQARSQDRTEFDYETALRMAPAIQAYLHVTTRVPLLKSLFAPKQGGPAAEVTYKLTDMLIKAPKAPKAPWFAPA